MKLKFDKLIEQNIAPKGAKMIGVYNPDGERMFKIPLGRLAPKKEKPIYSFGVISDTHIYSEGENYYENFNYKLENTLSFFEEQGASFVCHAGDITNRGFITDSGELKTDQFETYKGICDNHPNMPVYAVTGNHDGYEHGGKYAEIAHITNYLTQLEQYTGNGLYYAVECQNDLFAFIGQPTMSIPMNEEEISWFENLLIGNQEKRCFVFVHSLLKNDSGNPNNAYQSYLFENSSAGFSGIKQRFLDVITSHANCYLFHGHSHFMPELQEVDETTNYTNKNGFHSIHIPSLSAPAYLNEAGERGQDPNKSYGYLVDVYEDCIVLRARDFGIYENGVMVNPKWVSIATYKI